MTNTDTGHSKPYTEEERRELLKVHEAVSLAADYHTKINEANSKLHCSAQVLHSPMTIKLINAKRSLEKMLDNGQTHAE